MANSKQESKNCYCNVKLISMVNHFNGIFSLFCTNAESKQWKIYGSKMQEFHRQNNKICNSWGTSHPNKIRISFKLIFSFCYIDVHILETDWWFFFVFHSFAQLIGSVREDWQKIAFIEAFKDYWVCRCWCSKEI